MDELGDLVEYVLPHHPMRSGIHVELASRRVLLAQQTRDGMVPFWTRSALSHCQYSPAMTVSHHRQHAICRILKKRMSNSTNTTTDTLNTRWRDWTDAQRISSVEASKAKMEQRILSCPHKSLCPSIYYINSLYRGRLRMEACGEKTAKSTCVWPFETCVTCESLCRPKP
jgi:hypothetical protein